MALDGWDTALPDWEERIRNGQSLLPDLPLFERGVSRARGLLERFRMPDMANRPTYASLMQPWQFDLIDALFGSVDPETMKRTIREFFVLVPKKNGKTPTAAAIMLIALIINDRPGAEFYLISASHHIANYSFKTTKGIIEADPGIRSLFQIQDHLKRITHIETGAVLSIVSADGGIVTGSKASGILIDEMHELGKKSKADEIMAELRGGFATRPEGFLLTITTQSSTPPSGQFKLELERARRVRDGKERASLLPILYEFPKEIGASKKWQNSEHWPMVNPNLGTSVSMDFLKEEFEKAKIDGPEKMAIFASLHLNIEVGVGLKGQSWIGAQFWESAVEPGLTLEKLLERCEVAVVGIDGGGFDDLLGLAVVGREKQTRDWLHWGHAWAHPEVLARRKAIAPRLRDFEKAGDLTIIPNDDPKRGVEDVCDVVLRVFESGLLPESDAIGIDETKQGQFADPLMNFGLQFEQMVQIRQGGFLSGAIWDAEVRLKAKTLRHCGQPLMSWAVSNGKIERTGNYVKMVKETAGAAKIDPLIAMFNALILLRRNPVASTPEVIKIPENYEVF